MAGEGWLPILCVRFNFSCTNDLPGQSVVLFAKSYFTTRKQLNREVATMITATAIFMGQRMVDVLPFAILIAIMDRFRVDNGLVETITILLVGVRII